MQVGVGAVVFRGGDVLLIKRGKPPFLGQWSIPGGGLHYGESIEAGIAREVLEETGVVIRLLGFLGVFEALPDVAELSSNRHVVMIDHAAEWVAGEPCPGDDAQAAEFVRLDEALRRVSWDKTRQALAKAADLRNLAAKGLYSFDK